MDEEDNNNVYEVVVVGNSGVGKTSLIVRFCNNSFTMNDLGGDIQTMNVDCKTVDKVIDGSVVKLQIVCLIFTLYFE